MVYRNFHFRCILRIVVLTATIFLAAMCFFHYHFVTIPLLLLFFVFLQTLSLLRFVGKTNRDVQTFLESVRYSDFSRTFQVTGLGSSFDELKQSFNEVIQDFKNIRMEKEEHYFYLQNVLQHIGIGLLAFKNDGKIEMINLAAKKLFLLSNITNIKDLQSLSPQLVEMMFSLKANETKLLKIQEQDEILQLALHATEFKLHNQIIHLVSVQNIQSELEDQELQAWQKLIRVLTHEIMNSITPISSLSSTIMSLLEGVEEHERHDPVLNENINDIKAGLQTIQRRSTGLVHFVETYRNLTRIPQPNFSIFLVQNLFHNLKNLLKDELKAHDIQLFIDVKPPNLELTADEELLEQVFINLVKNAIHALRDTKRRRLIHLSGFINERGRIILQILDNGRGIQPEAMEKIFVPFFTTKPTGSGIGLSFSRQIIRLHGGTITAQSIPGQKTIFTMKF